MNKKHIGSKFDDFLEEEKLFEQVHSAAIKRVIVYQIAKEMKLKKTYQDRNGKPYEDQPRRAGTSARPR